MVWIQDFIRKESWFSNRNKNKTTIFLHLLCFEIYSSISIICTIVGYLLYWFGWFSSTANNNSFVFGYIFSLAFILQAVVVVVIVIWDESKILKSYPTSQANIDRFNTFTPWYKPYAQTYGYSRLKIGQFFKGFLNRGNVEYCRIQSRIVYWVRVCAVVYTMIFFQCNHNNNHKNVKVELVFFWSPSLSLSYKHTLR